MSTEKPKHAMSSESFQRNWEHEEMCSASEEIDLDEALSVEKRRLERNRSADQRRTRAEERLKRRGSNKREILSAMRELFRCILFYCARLRGPLTGSTNKGRTS